MNIGVPLMENLRFYGQIGLSGMEKSHKSKLKDIKEAYSEMSIEP